MEELERQGNSHFDTGGTQNPPRSSEEYVLLALTFGGGLAILPFFVMRFLSGDWAVAILDAVVSIGLLILGAVVLTSRLTVLPGRILAVLTLVGAVTTCYLKGPMQIFWLYPAMLATFYLLPPAAALLFNCIALFALTPLLYQQLDFLYFMTIEITFSISYLFAYVFADRNLEQTRRLRNQANIDPLLHIGNRRALDHKLNEIVSLQRRHPSPVCLIIYDLDHFKRVNDEHGHAVGDAVLTHVTQLVRGRLRETDALYRLGGEEFVVLPLFNSLDEAKHLAEDLRSLVERVAFSAQIKVTISLGVARYRDNESAAHWLNRADQALYQAKSAGRNRVVCAA